MIENEAYAEIKRHIASECNIPLHIYDQIERENAEQAKCYHYEVEQLQRDAKLMDFIRRLHKAIIKTAINALGIPPRIRHLATRHGNPRVRKKNRKRVVKILYGK